jgi:anti-sigma-K factor RskA
MTSFDDERLDHARAACREFDLGLPGYLEGERRPEVERHARECAFCSVVLADLDALRGQCRELPAEDPPALVWSNLRAALEAENILKEPTTGFWRLPRLTWAHWAAPASVVAALAVVAGFLVMAPGRLENGVPAAPAVAESASFEVSPDLAKTVGQLEQNYAARESSLDPSLKATYRKSLDSLDSSIKECRQTIQSKPSDALAQEYLLAAYTEKAEVLQSALEMDVR